MLFMPNTVQLVVAFYGVLEGRSGRGSGSRWVSMTPLGKPVVPLAGGSAARSSDRSTPDAAAAPVTTKWTGRSVGRRDANGYVFIVDRKQGVHRPAVADAGVIGKPDEAAGKILHRELAERERAKVSA